jgi:hypothetical protein
LPVWPERFEYVCHSLNLGLRYRRSIKVQNRSYATHQLYSDIKAASPQMKWLDLFEQGTRFDKWTLPGVAALETAGWVKVRSPAVCRSRPRCSRREL